MDRITNMSNNVGREEKLVWHVWTKYFPREISSFFKMSFHVNSLQTGHAAIQTPFLYIL